jgi:uracil-DNA glycosylase
MLIGEGPGWHEDQQGRPFVGNSGKFLNELLARAGLKREQVFITNVVKCRPPGNRDPEPAEIAACAPYLQRQLELLDPAVVVTLGRHSLQTFMPGARISQAHGTTRQTPAETGATDATTYAMYHPAAALRQHSLKETMLVDMCGLPDVLLEARARRSVSAVTPTAQAEAEDAVVAVVAVPVRPEPTPVPIVAPAGAAPAPREPAPAPREPAPARREPAAEPVAVIATGAPEPQLELFG